MRKKQIGVIGSMADLGMSGKNRKMAESLGKRIAEAGAILVYGFEGDMDSFSEVAAKSCLDAGGEVIAFLWGDPRGNSLPDRGIVVQTGQARGGGREFPMVLSCDGLISIGGGSGTLMEIAMAYQFGIPVVTLRGTGGWSDKLGDTFLDDRKRYLIDGFDDCGAAVSALMRKMLRDNNA